MKKKILFLMMLLLFPFAVFAAGSANISGPASVEKGNNVTIGVTLTNTAAWNLTLKGSGVTSGCSKIEADVTADGKNTSKTFYLTCNTNAIGNVNFTVTGDITSEDGTNSDVNLSKVVTVVTPRERESEARLESLSVVGYDISFDKDKMEYAVSVEPTVTSITINAKAISRYAQVSGTGQKKIGTDGEKYSIICTSETGNKKEYIINVSIIDKDPIKVKIGDEEYTVVKTNRLLVAPTGYSEKIIKIDDKEIPGYYNEDTELTIIGLKDKDGKIKYAIYDNGEYELYNENLSKGLLLYIKDKKLDGYSLTTIKVNDVEYKAYKIDNRFSFVYAMNINTGEDNYYKYDNVDETFQYYELEKKVEAKEKNNYLLFLTIGLGILFIVMVVLLIRKNNRKTKKGYC